MVVKLYDGITCYGHCNAFLIDYTVRHSILQLTSGPLKVQIREACTRAPSCDFAREPLYPEGMLLNLIIIWPLIGLRPSLQTGETLLLFCMQKNAVKCNAKSEVINEVQEHRTLQV